MHIKMFYKFHEVVALVSNELGPLALVLVNWFLWFTYYILLAHTVGIVLFIDFAFLYTRLLGDKGHTTHTYIYIYIYTYA